ncbi:MAG: hypothetical protein ACRYFK_18745, partial [Janthinobacterium lividum]
MRHLSLRFATALGAALLALPTLAQRAPTAKATKATAAPASTNRQTQLLAHEADITALLAKLTLEEKVHMLHANSAFAAGGVSRLG